MVVVFLHKTKEIIDNLVGTGSTTVDDIKQIEKELVKYLNIDNIFKVENEIFNNYEKTEELEKERFKKLAKKMIILFNCYLAICLNTTRKVNPDKYVIKYNIEKYHSLLNNANNENNTISMSKLNQAKNYLITLIQN